jgi:hypothetical protein
MLRQPVSTICSKDEQGKRDPTGDKNIFHSVMAGLIPATHVLLCIEKDVHARHRRQVCTEQTAMAGHDEFKS